jgi:hypothetical protein
MSDRFTLVDGERTVALPARVAGEPVGVLFDADDPQHLGHPAR